MPMPSAPLIALFLSVACLQIANGLFVVLLGLRMVDADFPTTVTGLIGGLLMQWPLGKTSDLFDRRTVFILLTFLLVVVALAMVPLVKTGFNALIVSIVI